MFTDVLRKYDVAQIKIYGNSKDKKIKLQILNSVKNKGVEYPTERTQTQVNNTKLENNIVRAKERIFEYAYCNDWDGFITLTIDKNKLPRDEISKFTKMFGIFIQNYYKRKGINIKYLLVPELHADKKSWHFHGFLSGVPASDLHQFRIGDKMGKYIAEKVKQGAPVYSWIPYADRFGFNDYEPIRNSEAIAKYMTKYINKQLIDQKERYGCNLYFCSHGLKRADTVAVGTVPSDIVEWDFQNDYVKTKWMPYSAEVLEALKNEFIKIDYARTRELPVPRLLRNQKRLYLKRCRNKADKLRQFVIQYHKESMQNALYVNKPVRVFARD